MPKTSFLTTRENSCLSLCILVLSAGEIVVPVRPDVILGTLSCGVDNRGPWGVYRTVLYAISAQHEIFSKEKTPTVLS